MEKLTKDDVNRLKEANSILEELEVRYKKCIELNKELELSFGDVLGED